MTENLRLKSLIVTTPVYFDFNLIKMLNSLQLIEKLHVSVNNYHVIKSKTMYPNMKSFKLPMGSKFIDILKFQHMFPNLEELIIKDNVGLIEVKQSFKDQIRQFNKSTG